MSGRSGDRRRPAHDLRRRRALLAAVGRPARSRSGDGAAGYYALSTTVEVRRRRRRWSSSSWPATDGVRRRRWTSSPPAPAAAPATQDVAPVQVLRTPGALDNVFRTLQTLPGVAATEEFGSRLAVRGGSPDQNLTMMDGVEMHDPYRLFGLTSAFNPEIIQRFELATGGFSAKYGDRLSSLLTVENRDGTPRQRLAGSASLSITDANVVLEGGLPRRATGSWLVTGRRTYYDLVAERITDNQFPGFADLQAKGVWEPAAGTTVTAVRLAQPAVGGARDRRGRRPRRVPGRHRERSGVGCASTPPSARRGQSHTVAGLLGHALDVRRRRRVREHQPALECARGRCDRHRPTWCSSGRSRCGTCRCARSWRGRSGAHVRRDRGRGASAVDGAAFAITGDRNPDGGQRLERRRAAPACPTCWCRRASRRPAAAPGSRTRGRRRAP